MGNLYGHQMCYSFVSMPAYSPCLRQQIITEKLLTYCQWLLGKLKIQGWNLCRNKRLSVYSFYSDFKAKEYLDSGSLAMVFRGHNALHIISYPCCITPLLHRSLITFVNCFSPFVSLWFCHNRRFTYTLNSTSGTFPDSVLHWPYVMVS